MTTTFDHTQLVAEIRLELGREEDFTLWLNAKVQVDRDGKVRAKPGLVRGASDLVGILAPQGRMVALEVKTGNARLEHRQKLFLELVRRRGGFGAVVRSTDDARAALERARQGAVE